MQTYKTAATARRGAFRQKLNPNEFVVEQGSDGLWFIKTSEPAPTDPSPVEPTSEPAPSAKTNVPQAKPIKPKTSKTKVKRQRISTTESPVAFIWWWLAQNDHAKMSRAEAIAALVKLGCAPGTSSTQRQRFLNASQAERTARAAKIDEPSTSGAE